MSPADVPANMNFQEHFNHLKIEVRFGTFSAVLQNQLFVTFLLEDGESASRDAAIEESRFGAEASDLHPKVVLLKDSKQGERKLRYRGLSSFANWLNPSVQNPFIEFCIFL